jgi:hypothetical protein
VEVRVLSAVPLFGRIQKRSSRLNVVRAIDGTSTSIRSEILWGYRSTVGWKIRTFQIGVQLTVAPDPPNFSLTYPRGRVILFPMKSDYSEKEFNMIKEISPKWAEIIEKDTNSTIMPPEVLRILAEECFAFNKQGPAVESLRRCYKALHYGNIYRNTPEYEKLIQM